MVVNRYARGREREYRTMNILKHDGWLVERSAASHGAVDVFAAKGGKLLLIQVKSGRARVKKEELEELVSWGKTRTGLQRCGTLRTAARWRGEGSMQESVDHLEAQVLLLRRGARRGASHIQDYPTGRTCLRGMPYQDDEPAEDEGRRIEALACRLRPKQTPV